MGAGAAAVLFLIGGLRCGAQSLFPALDNDGLLRAAASPAAFAEAAASAPLLRSELAAGDANGAANAAASGSPSSSSDDMLSGLPDAPEPQNAQDSQQEPSQKPLVAASPKTVPVTTAKPVVGRYVKYIPADSAAPQIHGREKFILGARDLYSAGNFAAMLVSAGWEQLTNGSPNYGTDRGAFGERLGAAGIRETTEGIFTDGVFSVMLHEDPRYFVLGPEYGLVHRTLYAITRPLVTRNSSNGHKTINGGLLLGYAASTALTNAYYPQSNRNLRDNLSSYGGSIGGAALGFFVDEFYDQALEALHLKKKS
ncbi:MAG TPA: hypothetical protein VHY48_01250 [Acidobacteriaceae bacterium]|jgi:hypothetical protein|nr:hypothetical protein [Acidobacteriaceae bacterium]